MPIQKDITELLEIHDLKTLVMCAFIHMHWGADHWFCIFYGHNFLE
jgi:hypothetical protein